MMTSGLSGRSLGDIQRPATSGYSLRWLLLVAPGMVLLVTGLASSDVLTQIHWRRVRELLLCGALLWLLPSLAGWLLGRSRTVVLCALLLLAIPLLHGIGPTLAVLGLFLLALRLGSLLGLDIEQQPLITQTAGLSVLAALAGWLLPWPMPLLDGVVALLRLAVGTAASTAQTGPSAAFHLAPAQCFLALVAGRHGVVARSPSQCAV